MSDAKSMPTDGAKGQIKVPCEVYSRIVGYLRPLQAWNDGKKQEFQERQTFKVPETWDGNA